jgi:hypothetical protein
VIAGGRLIAQGTLDDLRRQAGTKAGAQAGIQAGNGSPSLEDTFLALVADEAAAA